MKTLLAALLLLAAIIPIIIFIFIQNYHQLLSHFIGAIALFSLFVVIIFKTFNERGTTFVVVTHNSKLSDSQKNPRILKMKNGKLNELV